MFHKFWKCNINYKTKKYLFLNVYSALFKFSQLKFKNSFVPGWWIDRLLSAKASSDCKNNVIFFVENFQQHKIFDGIKFQTKSVQLIIMNKFI